LDNHLSGLVITHKLMRATNLLLHPSKDLAVSASKLP